MALPPPCLNRFDANASSMCRASSAALNCGGTEIFELQVEQGVCRECAPLAAARPGFTCQGGSLVPCPIGFFCTANASMALQTPCNDGQLCLEGFAAPLACPLGSTCNGSAVRISYVAIFMLVMLSIALAVLFIVLSRRKARLLRLSHLATERYTEEGTALGGDFIREVPAVDVSFRNVGLRLRAQDRFVLSGITGRFPAGSLVALMGPSGGGKTVRPLCGPWPIANLGDGLGPSPMAHQQRS